MPQIRRLAVLFDLDGTLIDSIDLIVSAASHAFRSRAGPAPTDEEFAAGIGRPLVDQFGPYCATDQEMQALIASYRQYQLAHHDRLTTVYDGIPAAIQALDQAGHALAVVTSKVDHMANRALVHVGLAPRFSVVIGCDATSKHKPDAEPVLLALERTGMTAPDAIFVGDSPYDIMAGRAAGVLAVGALWGPFPRQVLEDAGADVMLEHPSELVPLVEHYREFGRIP